MKKLTFVAAMAIAAASFTACGNGTPKANLKSDLDTFSYAIGMAQSQGLKGYLVGQLNVDTAYLDEFFKGLNDGVNAGDDKKQSAYYAGIQIGQQLSNQIIKGINRDVFGDDSTKTISLKNFMAGFVSGTNGDTKLMGMEQATITAQTKMQTLREEYIKKAYGDNKVQGEKYLAEYKKKEGVKALKNGVLYKVIKAGSGAVPTDSSRVKVMYEGKTIDGNVFDSNYKSGEPVTFAVNQVIPGFTEALTNMPVGSTWEIVIPQDQAYADREQGVIKPFSTLIFKVELVSIEK